MADNVILQFQNISKQFPGVRALEEINLDVRRGEVLAIMGENGAGKSTLMKIAAGIYHPDQGQILVDGMPAIISDAQKALNLGIGMVPQELNLIPEMNVSENVMLGLEPRGALGIVDTKTLHRQARVLLEALGLDVDTSEKVKNLSVAQQQIVQIARALANQCHILIMDEPTAALSQRETNTLIENIGRLRESGTTIIYISHRIREVKQIADRIAVLRDGRLITVQPCADMTDDDITQAMIGRPLKEFLSPHDSHKAANKVVLEARGLSSRHHFHDVSFELREGEILGFAGLVGAGRSEVCSSLFGSLKLDSGEIWIDGTKARIHSPVDAIRHGIGLVPEERKRQGLFLLLNVMENISIPFIKRFQRLVAVNRRNEQRVAADLSQQLHIRTPSLDQPVRFLSGGNQQKVILARWLGSSARIMIMDEPTRGIDVNSKAEIHTLIADIAAQGKSVIVVSSEAQELMALADRIIVMREGHMVGEVNPKTTTEEHVLRLAMWGQQLQEVQPANGLQSQPI